MENIITEDQNHKENDNQNENNVLKNFKKTNKKYLV